MSPLTEQPPWLLPADSTLGLQEAKFSQSFTPTTKKPTVTRRLVLYRDSLQRQMRGITEVAKLPSLKRVIVTPAVYPRLDEPLHFDIQSTGQKSHCVNINL